MKTLKEIEAELDAIKKAQPEIREIIDGNHCFLPKKAIEVLKETVDILRTLNSEQRA